MHSGWVGLTKGVRLMSNQNRGLNEHYNLIQYNVIFLFIYVPGARFSKVLVTTGTDKNFGDKCFLKEVNFC